MKLRGYVVSGPEPEDGALLVFATGAPEAKRMGWRVIVHDYGLADYTDVKVRWVREARPEAWGVREPAVLEPGGCKVCLQWYSDGPIGLDGTCRECAAEAVGV